MAWLFGFSFAYFPFFYSLFFIQCGVIRVFNDDLYALRFAAVVFYL